MFKRLLELLKLNNPHQPALQQCSVSCSAVVASKTRTEQEFCHKVSDLLKECKQWHQVYRLWKLTCAKLNWEEGGKAKGLTQVVLSLEFDVIQLKAQITGL